MEIEDTYMRLLVNEQVKLNIDVEQLCEGICTEQVYRKMLSGERVLSRAMVKRLLARLGVDNANYEHYLDKPDYDVWIKRMKIINAIEDDNIELAEKLLEEYMPEGLDERKSHRHNLETQFGQFMRLQIMKHRESENMDNAAMYKETLMLTVPNLEMKPTKGLLLSPLELCLLTEYISASSKDEPVEATLEAYRELLSYISDMPYGKLAMAKVYPKAVVCLYKSIRDKVFNGIEVEIYDICEELLSYCERAFKWLKERKFLYYMTELLEMRIELCEWLKNHSKSTSRTKEYSEKGEESKILLEALVDEYNYHNLNPYMMNDCYLYRESGMFCIGEVIYKRRSMLGMSRKELCEGIVSERTLENTEKIGNALQRYNFQKIFSRLRLCPDYINMSIVTDKKEAVDIYEELRFKESLFEYDDVRKLLSKLKKLLPDNYINRQYIKKVEIINQWMRNEIGVEEYIQGLKEALEYTVSLDKVLEAEDNLMLTYTEVELLYSISLAMKRTNNSDTEVWKYIEVLWHYCEKLKEDKMEDSKIGIYELIMTYIASLLGDAGEYDRSSKISQEMLRLLLKLRRASYIPTTIYNIAWNEDKNGCTRQYYKRMLHKSIQFSNITDNYSRKEFYERKLHSCC